jgi:16S rRNA (guanine527-N7)-methyltransferase
LANVEAEQAVARLNDLLSDGGLAPLNSEQAQRFSSYLSLLLLWNAKTNLTAIRDTEGILSRHFVECIACAQWLPSGISSLLDLGSGAGFPGIPISICRPEIDVTLAESQGKKAAFLREALRRLGLNAQVHAGRAKQITRQFDCVTLRAVDKMEEAVRAATRLLDLEGRLVLMTTLADLDILKRSVGEGFSWNEPIALPGGERRILALGYRR